MAPRLQVLRLSQDAASAAAAAAVPARGNGAAVPVDAADVVAHVQRVGDVGARMGDWLGERGSKLWIEGFAITPPDGIQPGDIEYQAVLGRGWNSPWMEGGKFCGSRGMALPLLGVRLRLKGAAAKSHKLRYAASFVDGTLVGPVDAGEACEAESLAALEAVQVLLEPRAGAKANGRAAAPPAGKGNGQPAVGLPDLMAAQPLPAMKAAGKPGAKPAPAAKAKKPAPASRRAR
jgi:hypothetical protein